MLTCTCQAALPDIHSEIGTYQNRSKFRCSLDSQNDAFINEPAGSLKGFMSGCQAMLLTWRRNQNKQLCGSLLKIGKRLHAFGNCIDASRIVRLFDWHCRWLLVKRPSPSQAPNKGGPFIPRMNDGAF